MKDALREGRDILFDIDWQGTQQLELGDRRGLVTIFILPPSMAELERRLRERGTDCRRGDRRPDAARRRTRSATGPNMNMCWSTTTMDECLAQVRAIVAAERLEASRARPASSTSSATSIGPAALSFEQLQEPRRGEEVAAAVLERRFGLRVRAPLLDLPALVDADRVPRLLGRDRALRAAPAPRPASRRSSPAATGRQDGRRRAPRPRGDSRSTVAGGWATWITPWRRREIDVVAPPRPAEQRVPRCLPARATSARGPSAR